MKCRGDGPRQRPVPYTSTKSCSGGTYVKEGKRTHSRAIGTILDPKGKAIAAIAKDESYFGEADILGKPHVTGYEPIRDANNVIGVYYVGYLKN